MKCEEAEFLELSKEVLDKGASLRFQARGGSMYPFIRGGEFIHVEPLGRSDINYADIIFYHGLYGKIIVHRVIKKRVQDGKVMLLTKGDSSPGPDGYTGIDNVLGRVAAIEKGNMAIQIDKWPWNFINIVYTGLLPLSRWSCSFLIKLIKIFLPKERRGKVDEDKLIILLSRLELDKAERPEVEELLRSELDWSYIYDRSKKEMVSGFCYRHLKRYADLLPKSAMERWESLNYGTSLRNADIYDEINDLARAFSEKKIRVIFLKGVFLAERIYKDIGLRPTTDIDILVKKEDIPVADEMLRSSGYIRPACYEDFLANDPSHINAVFYKRDTTGNFCVHLHRHLVNSTWPVDRLVKKIDMERIWSLAGSYRIGDTDILSLSPEHLLIYLCLHGFSHSFDRLVLLTDILETLRHYGDGLDWDLVMQEAERFDLSMVLVSSLIFTSKILGFELPELKKDRHARSGLFETAVHSSIRRGVCSYRLSYLAFLLQEEGFINKSRFMIKTIFPSSYIVGQSIDLPASQIRPSHYRVRIMKNLSNLLPRRK